MSAPPPAPPHAAGASDDASVAAALSATLSVDASSRTAAEAALSSMSSHPAHAAALLRLAAGTSPVVAAAAAVRLKNATRAARAPAASHAAAALAPEARAHVRENLLPALAVAREGPASAALAETLRWLVLLDFPARWPGLLEQIRSFLGGDLAQVAAALSALHKIAKCYEFRSNEPSKLDANDPNDAGIAHPREPLDRIVELCFPDLLVLFGKLNAESGTAPRLCQKMIVKIFWCSMQFVMPPHMAEPGVLNNWLDALISLFEQPVVVQPQSSADEDLAAMPEFKAKKWIANVLLRFLKRYSNPKRIAIDEPHTRRVAVLFQEQYASRATAAMLNVLSWPTSGGHLSGRVANIAIDYLQEAVETASLWSVMLPHIHLLLSQIIFPYLCFTDADMEVWEEDPIEYVRKQSDINEDYTSPRMAAIGLLSQLGELRPKNTVLPFMTHLVSTVLEPYRATVVGSPARAALARQKVGAMQALSACKLRLQSKPDLAATFLEVLTVHVEPDIRSEFGFLRAMAHKLLGDVASSGWSAFSSRLGEASLRGAVSALEDPELPVQATAASALHFLMEQDSAQPLIAPFAPQLLERLLHVMDRMSDGFVSLLPTLDKLVDRYPDELMPLAVPLMRRLVAAFQTSAAEAKAQGDDEDGDDDLLFQAAQMLQLISSVITTAGEWSKPSDEERAEMFRVLETELQPVLIPMFDEGNQVFAEETLDVLHTLILQTGELKKKLSPFLMSMVPRLVKSFDVWAGEYVSSDIVGPIEAYIAYDLDALLQMEGAVPALMSIAQRLWMPGVFDDSEAVDGAKIADALVLSLSKHETRGSELSNSVVCSLAREAAKRCSSTTGGEGPLRVRLFGTVMLAAYYDGSLALKTLGGPDQLMQFVSLVVSDVDSLTRIHDKKAAILGLSSLLRVTDSDLGQTSPSLVRGIIGLQDRIDRQRAGDERKNMQMTQLAAWAGAGGGAGAGGVRSGGGSDAVASGNGSDGVVGAPVVPAGIGDASGVPVALGGVQPGISLGAQGATGEVDDDSSELDDDEDASNRLLDGNESGHFGSLEKLSLETGIPVAELEILNATGGVSTSTGGFFDFDDFNEDDDEGDNPTSVLDEIDEIRFFVESVKLAMSKPWWGSVGQEERLAIDRLAGRVPVQV